MPSSPAALTPEAIEIKRRGRQRLVGAVTIALLLVVFVPMILDSEPRKAGKDIELAIPPKEGLPALPSPTAPVEKPAEKVEAPVPPEVAKADAPKTETKPVPAKAEPAPVAPKAEVKAEPKTAAKVPPAPPKVAEAAKPQVVAAAPVKATPAKAEGFAVQLGAFSDAEKLQQLRAKMKAARIPVFTEPVKGDGVNLTRLRAGPYKTRELAEKGLQQVKKAGADGQVIPLP